jgi:hypothetical protein
MFNMMDYGTLWDHSLGCTYDFDVVKNPNYGSHWDGLKPAEKFEVTPKLLSVFRRTLTNPMELHEYTHAIFCCCAVAVSTVLPRSYTQQALDSEAADLR